MDARICLFAIVFLTVSGCTKSQAPNNATENATGGEAKPQQGTTPPKRLQVAAIMGVDLSLTASNVKKALPDAACSGWGSDGLMVSGVELVSTNCHRDVNKEKELAHTYYFLNDPKLGNLTGRLARIEITLGGVKTAEAAGGVLEELKTQFGQMSDVPHQEASPATLKKANFLARYMGYGQATMRASEEPAKGATIEYCPKTNLPCDA